MAAQFLAGFLLSLAIAYAGFRKEALSTGGMIAAIFEGTFIFGIGGWMWGALLIAFFALSSALSFYRRREKRTLAEKFAKGSRRDVGQVLANGGLGLLLALACLAAGESARPLLFAAYVGAMATVNADTWATELGVLGQRPPRLITTWRVVDRGTSGGISPWGTAAALLGGATIGLTAALFDSGEGVRWLLVGALGGLAGALFDSFLGATVQAIYYSEARQKETEQAVERDGTPNRLLRGWRWMDNDIVNFLSSLVGAAVAAALWRWMG